MSEPATAQNNKAQDRVCLRDQSRRAVYSAALRSRLGPPPPPPPWPAFWGPVFVPPEGPCWGPGEGPGGPGGPGGARDEPGRGGPADGRTGTRLAADEGTDEGAAGRADDDETGRADNDETGRADDDETGRADDDAMRGDTGGAVEGDTGGALEGETSGALEGETSGATDGDTGGTLEGDTSGATDCETGGATDGKTSGALEGDTSGVTGPTTGATRPLCPACVIFAHAGPKAAYHAAVLAAKLRVDAMTAALMGQTEPPRATSAAKARQPALGVTASSKSAVRRMFPLPCSHRSEALRFTHGGPISVA